MDRLKALQDSEPIGTDSSATLVNREDRIYDQVGL